jgi:transposase InsO family protein
VLQRPLEPAQYTSEQIATACADLPVLRSMGRTGVCWDNAAAESFWSTLKTEFYNRRLWPTKAEAGSPSAPGSKTATTDADVIPRSA